MQSDQHQKVGMMGICVLFVLMDPDEFHFWRILWKVLILSRRVNLRLTENISLILSYNKFHGLHLVLPNMNCLRRRFDFLACCSIPKPCLKPLKYLLSHRFISRLDMIREQVSLPGICSRLTTWCSPRFNSYFLGLLFLRFRRFTAYEISSDTKRPIACPTHIAEMK